jgi:hypothetical protein
MSPWIQVHVYTALSKNKQFFVKFSQSLNRLLLRISFPDLGSYTPLNKSHKTQEKRKTRRDRSWSILWVEGRDPYPPSALDCSVFKAKKIVR